MRYIKIALLILLSVTATKSEAFFFTLSGPEKRATIHSTGFGKPDSHQFAVAIHFVRYRRPTGIINTFPNGGWDRITESSVKIYLCNAHNKQVTYLATIKQPENMEYDFHIFIDKAWDGDHFFLTLKGRDGTFVEGADISKPPSMITYRFEPDGSYKEVPSIPENAIPTAQVPEDFLGRYIKIGSHDLMIETATDIAPEMQPTFQFDLEKETLLAINN